MHVVRDVGYISTNFRTSLLLKTEYTYGFLLGIKYTKWSEIPPKLSKIDPGTTYAFRELTTIMLRARRGRVAREWRCRQQVSTHAAAGPAGARGHPERGNALPRHARRALVQLHHGVS